MAAMLRLERAAHLCVAAAVFGLVPAPSRADGLSFDSFIQTHISARTNRSGCVPGMECDYPWAELRGQLKAEGKNESGSAAFAGRFDLLHDAALNDNSFNVRELSGDLVSASVSLRAGRQVITWGVGDLLFINDTFPKDWVAMFTGQPMQYLKLGSDALKVNAFPGPVNLEFVAAGFRPDRLPDARRFIFADPLPAGLPRRTIEPGNSANELEVSAKASGYVGNWELAGYASRTHYRSPAWGVTGGEVVGGYPRLWTYGASLNGPVGKGVLSLEGGYYDSRDDRGGSNPAVENSQFRALAGYSRQLWDDGTLGVQIYGEWMRDFDSYRATLPAGFPAKNRLRKVATVRFTQFFAHQTITLNLFGFFGVSERDRYFIPSIRYAFSDNLWAEIGANYFAGNRTGSFGSLQSNRNAYVTVRYGF